MIAIQWAAFLQGAIGAVHTCSRDHRDSTLALTNRARRLATLMSTPKRNAVGGYMQFETTIRNRATDHKGPTTLLSKLLVLVCLLTIAPVLFGQGISGHIIGTVEDTSDAVIPNAQLTITNQETGVITHAESNGVGEFRSDNLPPGTYRVKVGAAGFRDSVSDGNIVTVDSNIRVDVKMLVGTSSQTVEVTASNPLVDTTDSSLGEVMNEDEVEGLPLNGRVFSQLIITV